MHQIRQEQIGLKRFPTSVTFHKEYHYNMISNMFHKWFSYSLVRLVSCIFVGGTIFLAVSRNNNKVIFLVKVITTRQLIIEYTHMYMPKNMCSWSFCCIACQLEKLKSQYIRFLFQSLSRYCVLILGYNVFGHILQI